MKIRSALKMGFIEDRIVLLKIITAKEKRNTSKIWNVSSGVIREVFKYL